MAGGKLTPRQKMINMMYLVLTALLALNVSTEVLNAFKLVNEGLQTSNGSLSVKNESIYKAFDKQKQDNPEKAKVPFDKAQEARKISKELFDVLESYKTQVIKLADGRDPETGDIVQRDNIDIATQMFCEQNGKNGKELQKKILDARSKLLALVDEKDRANFSISLNGETPKLKEDIEKVETKEATGSGSVGSYSTPAMWAKSTKKKDWGPSRKTQLPGGTFVSVKKKCKKFPYCNQGDIKALNLYENDNLKNAIKNISKKYNISETTIKSILNYELEKIDKIK
jgi:hypothetical protein